MSAVWIKAVALQDSSRVVWARLQGTDWNVCDYNTGECCTMPASAFRSLYVTRAWCPPHIRAWLDSLPCFDRWMPGTTGVDNG